MGKFNEDQLQTVVEFMTANPVLLQKRTRDNNKQRMELWKELAEKLNKLGPPCKSENNWRRSWAKKKFEMGKVKKRRVSVYADLDHLMARAAELEEEQESGEEYEVSVATVDPLDIKKRPKRSRQQEEIVIVRQERRSSTEGLKMEIESEDPVVEYITNDNDLQEMDQSLISTHRTKHRSRKRLIREESARSHSESSADELRVPDQKRLRCERQPENSVELFFRSLAMEVNKANLTSEHLFNLEWSVLKVVSEKIKEFTTAVRQDP